MGGSTGVASVSVTSANGFGGDVATPTTTPAITIKLAGALSDGGLLYRNGDALGAQLGTSTTVYHGNAAGVGSFSSVVSGDLAASLSFVTPNINVATGTSLALTGIFSSGSASGTTGKVTMTGATSGSAAISVAAAAGTPADILLPTSTGTNGQVLTTNGATPQQLSWSTPSSGLTIGTTAITSGTNGRILYDNSAVVGELTPVSGGVLGATSATAPAYSIAGVATALMSWGGAGATPTSPLSMLVTGQNTNAETWTLFNSTASTGVTKLVIKDGAGTQTGTASALTLQNSAGTAYFASSAFAGPIGQFVGNLLIGGASIGNTTNGIYLAATTSTLEMSAAYSHSWSSTTGASGTIDTTMCRKSAGIVEAGASTGCAQSGTWAGKFQSSDGTNGATVTTCTGFKDGLCISGT